MGWSVGLSGLGLRVQGYVEESRIKRNVPRKKKRTLRLYGGAVVIQSRNTRIPVQLDHFKVIFGKRLESSSSERYTVLVSRGGD